MKTVMGCIMHILRKTVERSPTITPNKPKGDSSTGESSVGETHDHDEAMNLEDNTRLMNE